MDLIEQIKTKPRLIFLVLAVLVLTALVLLILGNLGVGEKESLPTQRQPEPGVEVFSLAASILRVDSQNNLVFVRHPTRNEEIKIILNGRSEILKLEFPFDPSQPPAEGVFTPKLTKITINDLKPGLQALIESDENIYQKTEFDEVRRIQVLP